MNDCDPQTDELFKALAHSYNLATVNLGRELGLPGVVRHLEGLGLEKKQGV